MKQLTLTLLAEELAICRLSATSPLPDWLGEASFWSATRTKAELSLVVPASMVPPTWQAVLGWRALKVEKVLDFSMTGILAAIAAPLATAGISIFTISTYDTDYVLLRSDDLERALTVLAASGHRFTDAAKASRE